jgi:hypothetical protein
MVIFPGLAFACAISLATVAAGNDGFTTNSRSDEAIAATGDRLATMDDQK